MAREKRKTNPRRIKQLERALKEIKKYHGMCATGTFMRYNAWEAFRELRGVLAEEKAGFTDE